VAWFPERFCRVLSENHPPEAVHTVVVWTKFPGTLLKSPYREVLSRYGQLYVHLTITGLGGTELEPKVPHYKETLSMIPDLINFVGSPERIRVRPDPLIKVTGNGISLTNLDKALEIIKASMEYGINTFSTSFCTHYSKVIKRLARHGFELHHYPVTDQIRIYNKLKENAKPGIVYACCIPGAPTSRCIDAELLTKLHPKKEKCSPVRAKNQRELCGCTNSTDIGWYDMRCRSGCLYCYANPT